MQADMNTILTVAGFLVTMATIVWKHGGTTQRLEGLIASFNTRMNDIETDRKAWRDKIEHDIDVRFSATQSLINLLQAQLADTRENIAGNYIRKADNVELERRVADKQKEIVDTIKALDGKIERLLNRGPQ
jgi:hypothetical protein